MAIEAISNYLDGRQIDPKVSKETALRLLMGGAKFVQTDLALRRIADELPKDKREWAKPKKTLSASIAIYGAYTDRSVQRLHSDGLVEPVSYAYNYLAVFWDYRVDGCGKVYDCDDEQIWSSAILQLTKNPNVYKPHSLVNALEDAKVEYQKAELALKTFDPESWDPLELMDEVVSLRQKSFGRTAEILTRVLNAGVENPRLERNCANLTLALGEWDAKVDFREDERNHTMTEARAGLLVDEAYGLPKNTTINRLIAYHLSEVN